MEQKIMFKVPIEFKELASTPALTLAMVGDSIYDLYVRTRLSAVNPTAKNLHKRAVKFVCAAAQAKSVYALEESLTEEETAVFKRGRNTKSATVPKNALLSDYRAATGFEALLGYLYLKGESERLDEILKSAFDFISDEEI